MWNRIFCIKKRTSTQWIIIHKLKMSQTKNKFHFKAAVETAGGTVPAVTWLGGGSRESCGAISTCSTTASHALTLPNWCHGTAQSICREVKLFKYVHSSADHKGFTNTKDQLHSQTLLLVQKSTNLKNGNSKPQKTCSRTICLKQHNTLQEWKQKSIGNGNKHN